MAKKAEIQKKEINDAMKMAVENCYLQINGVDVMIPYIAGAPGGGKTQATHQLGQILDKCAVLSTHFAITPYEEHSGIPQFTKVMINNKEEIGTVWSFPSIMKSLYELAEKNNIVIWLLDDMHLCGAIHMSLLYELLTERKLRDYHLPNNVAIILAGNHGHNKAGSKTMFSAIVNRVFMMPVFTGYDEWKKNFAIKNNVHNAITSFLKNDKYKSYFHEEEQVDSPWGSPRSWTRFSNFLQANENWHGNIKESDILYIGQGHVSKAAASEFTMYYKIFSKFDIPKIFEGYKEFELPDSTIDQYALAYAMCSHITSISDTKIIIEPFSHIIYKYIKETPDLGLMIIHEILDIERFMNKRNIYINVSRELNNLEPGITNDLLKQVSDA